MHRIIGRLELCTYPTYPMSSTFYMFASVFANSVTGVDLETSPWRLDSGGMWSKGAKLCGGIGYYERGL